MKKAVKHPVKGNFTTLNVVGKKALEKEVKEIASVEDKQDFDKAELLLKEERKDLILSWLSPFY